MVAAATRIAYAQVDTFLKLLDQKYVDMIPRNILYFIKQEKDSTYDTPIYSDIPMNKQNLTDETLALIAYFNLNYWCQDETEKELLRRIYKENDKKYNNANENSKIGISNLFKDKETNYYEGQNELVECKEDGFFRRIILRLKYYIKIKRYKKNSDNNINNKEINNIKDKSN